MPQYARLFPLIPALLVLASIPCNTARAQVSTTPSRSGYVTRVTDMRTEQMKIVDFRVSRDGSTAVFLAAEIPEDPRGCTSRQSLWMVDIATGALTLIEQGFTYDTGVGNFCASNMWTNFDICDNGRKIVYVRTGAGDLLPDLMLYDANAGSSSKLLELLTHTSYDITEDHNIDPFGGLAVIEISGDGNFIFFVNAFGPQGPEFDIEIQPDHSTIYRVAASSGSPEKVLSVGDLADLGLDPVPVAVTGGGGRLEAPYDGSYVITPVGSSFPSGNWFQHLLKVTPGSSKAVVQTLLSTPPEMATHFDGPSLTPDGSRMAYYWYPEGDYAGDRGVLFMDMSPPGSPVLLDEGVPFAAAINPHMSSDGTTTVQVIYMAGDSHHRIARTDGSGLEIVGNPMVRTVRGSLAFLNDDATQIVLSGVIRDNGASTDYEYNDILLFQWSPAFPPPGAPSVGGVTVDPNTVMVKDPGVHPAETHTFRYTASGTNFGVVYTAAWDDTIHVPQQSRDVASLHSVWGILDDGAWEGVDETAGDGVYTDGGIWVLSGFPGDLVNFRFAATTTDGHAAFVDFELPVLPVPDAAFQMFIPVGEQLDQVFGATGVTIDFMSNSTGMSVRIDRIPASPLDLRNGLSGQWRILQIDPSAFEAVFTFEYNEALVTGSEAGLVLYVSEAGEAPWTPVASIPDTVANTLTTADPQTSFSYWAIAEPGFEGFTMK